MPCSKAALLLVVLDSVFYMLVDHRLEVLEQVESRLGLSAEPLSYFYFAFFSLSSAALQYRNLPSGYLLLLSPSDQSADRRLVCCPPR